MKTHYQTLGLKEGASQDEIKEAYERLSKELDPTNNHEDFFVEEYIKVREAYKALSSSSILATEAGARNQSVQRPPKPKLKEKPINANQSTSKGFNKKWIGLIGVIAVLISAGIGVYVFVQPDFEQKETIVVDGLRKTKSDLQPITGVVEGIGPFKNGLKSGYFIESNKEGTYKSGVKSGKWTYYHTNDFKFLKAKVNYLNGKKDGPYKEWNNRGVLIAEGTYYQGMEIGLNKTWTNKGVLNKVVDYEADRLTLYNGDGSKIYDGSLKEWQYEKEQEELARKEGERRKELVRKEGERRKELARKEAERKKELARKEGERKKELAQKEQRKKELAQEKARRKERARQVASGIIIFEQNGHGIIAAKKDLGRMSWYEAKTACADLVLNGFSDWRLPTKEELNMMYLQKSTIGGFANYYYWSSTEVGNGNAWRQGFGNGQQYGASNGAGRVRAVRAF
jgi:antitoxin component YwqK of YwqJK toxin-antitoxin module